MVIAIVALKRGVYRSGANVIDIVLFLGEVASVEVGGDFFDIK